MFLTFDIWCFRFVQQCNWNAKTYWCKDWKFCCYVVYLANIGAGRADVFFSFFLESWLPPMVFPAENVTQLRQWQRFLKLHRRRYWQDVPAGWRVFQIVRNVRWSLRCYSCHEALAAVPASRLTRTSVCRPMTCLKPNHIAVYQHHWACLHPVSLLLLRWVIVRGYTILVFNQATQANSAWSSLRG